MATDAKYEQAFLERYRSFAQAVGVQSAKRILWGERRVTAADPKMLPGPKALKLRVLDAVAAMLDSLPTS